MKGLSWAALALLTAISGVAAAGPSPDVVAKPAGLRKRVSRAPARWTKTLSTTPDFVQTDARAKLPGDGHAYCAPVAVANSFVQLAREGYTRLAPLAPRLILTQIDIVRVLADDSHMATCCKTGTSTAHLVSGVERYVRERGYAIKSWAYRGWRPRPRHVPATSTVVDLSWIRAQVAQPATGAWVNVGWYVKGTDSKGRETPGVFRRTGGHWMTLSGYGVDETGHMNTGVLIMRDPSPRSGARARFEFIDVRPAPKGALRGPQRGLPRPTAGMLRLADGIAMPVGTDLALIDGVVVLHMQALHRKPKKETPAAQHAAGDSIGSR